MVVNKILFKFNEKSTKLNAYAEDIVLLVKGKFLSIISELMESVLYNKWTYGIGILLKWPGGKSIKNCNDINYKEI